MLLSNVVDVAWPVAEVLVNEALMRELLSEQFPEFSNLPIRPMGEGFDNHLFQLGEDHVARVPRRARGVEPLENEMRWLETVTSTVTLATPSPALRGEPGPTYRWPWMIGSYIDGVSGEEVDEESLYTSARTLGSFMRALHVNAPANAPLNPWRSVPLAERSHDVEARLVDLVDDVDTVRAAALFEWACTAPSRKEPATWLHGDLHPGNLIYRHGRLVGVVDFGDLCAGDPSTDLGGALLALPYEALETFFAAYGVDDDASLARAVGWSVVFGIMMVSLGRACRPTYLKIGRRALENALRLSNSLR